MNIGSQIALPLEDSVVAYNRIPAKLATFKSGLAALVHRWFRLTPSFGPDLVQTMLDKLACRSDERVLDPFSGASTTLIECQLLGIKCYGFEINPFLHWVGQTSLDWSPECHSLKESLEAIEERFKIESKAASVEDLERFGLTIPPIHNPLRWWRPDVIIDLLHLRKLIDEVSGNNRHIRNFLRLALAGVLVPDLTNVTLGKLQLHFIDRSAHHIDVIGTFTAHARKMIEDLQSVQENASSVRSELFHVDSTDISPVASKLAPISCVVTSPPYPNRYSYVWNTRPHLYFFDFISKANEASSLDTKTIGGTWGVATSMLQKGTVAPFNDAVERVVAPLIHEIRQKDNLMANYVAKYFNLIAKQILELEKLPQESLRCAYVVGNSRIKEVYVETDVLLGRLFEELNVGYETTLIDRIRQRNSGKDLHESIVYARKRP
ncbi:DNA methyltransferase [Burkholderia ambifaria]|uniref:DNA methyltransferase n=1 Tax=Burkholderia ambifaria TaxID=152480 RepID=UPI00158D6110|nr:DNA methyltransferase [Burkholderia ambifaria]